MRADKEYCSRKISLAKTTISYEGKIKIIGPSYHITGQIHGNMIPKFKASQNKVLPAIDIQVISLNDHCPSKQAINWIYKKILKGKFDHLINPKGD